jgi:hypothetical protein
LRSEIRTKVLKVSLSGCKIQEGRGEKDARLFCYQNGAATFQNRYCPMETQMDVLKMLADLRQEREQIEEAIVTLERLAQGRGRRRGRPPAWMSALKRRGRPPGSKNKAKENAAVG